MDKLVLHADQGVGLCTSTAVPEKCQPSVFATGGWYEVTVQGVVNVVATLTARLSPRPLTPGQSISSGYYF